MTEARSLDADALHVWRASLDVTPSLLAMLEATLSTEERARAARFVRIADGARYVAAHAFLRDILGRYLERRPESLRFRSGPFGKPELDREGKGASAATALQFSLSHADGLALVALTRGRRVGVDLERVEPALAEGRIPEHFLSPHEVAELRALPVDQQLDAFFACWTRKEAYVKARGDGMSLRFDSFDVTLTPGIPAALLHAPGDPNEAGRWTLWTLVVAPGYAGAVAVEGQAWPPDINAWEPDQP